QRRAGDLLRDAGRRAEDARSDGDADDQRDGAPEPQRPRQTLRRSRRRCHESGKATPIRSACRWQFWTLSPLDRPGYGWVRCRAMLPARRDFHDSALDAALAKLGTDDRDIDLDRPDSYLTTVRRLPALIAQHAPFPPALDGRLVEALASRGITQPYTHQA